MELTIKVEKTVQAKMLIVKSGVRYWEDAEIDGSPSDEDGVLIPCKMGDLWCPEIDIDTGQVMNWNLGTKAAIHFKVCDCCGWEIRDDNGNTILAEEDGYVPSTLCPKGNGYGDYIKMDINEDGLIANWRFKIEDFLSEDL